jgi:hypothetical protein
LPSATGDEVTMISSSHLPVGVAPEDLPLQTKKKEPQVIREIVPSPLAREEWLLTPGERKPFGGFIFFCEYSNSDRDNYCQ